MSHYCCKRCGQRYDDCTCSPSLPIIKQQPAKPDFREIACDSAWINRYNHSYIPTDKQEFKEWEPHPWVLEAIKIAYQMGLEEE